MDTNSPTIEVKNQTEQDQQNHINDQPIPPTKNVKNKKRRLGGRRGIRRPTEAI